MRPLLLVYALLSVFVGAGCQPEDRVGEAVDVTWRSEPALLRVGAANVIVEVADTLGAPVSGADVTIEANMTHPGMQPVFAPALEIQPGVYRGSLEFSMQGEWFMEITGMQRDGSIFVREIRFTVLAAEE